ncbi:MAG: hypothetical protein GY725_09050 [bacterium]|nr:hypothetical protein [bacterium]
MGARLTGQAQLVANRTYGDFERGTAVRVSEVDGADHLTILTAQEAADRIASWIAKSVGPGVSARPELSGSDPRASWALLGLLASVVLLWGLPEAIAPLGRRVVQTAPQRPLVWLVSLLAVLLFVSALIGATDARISGGILQFMPMLVVRELFAFLGLAGVLLLVIAGRYGRARAEGLGDYRTWIAGGLLFAFAYVAIGTLANSYNNLFPASHRLVWCALGTLILLPYFGVLEWVLRGPGRTGVWLPIVGKLLTLAALFGGALSGLLPGVVLLGVAPIALFFALFELVAYRLSRVSPNPWTAALFQAAFTSVAFGAIMPFTG